MPLDMPPQQVVEYRMERPVASGPMAQAAVAVASARRAAAGREIVSPALDADSPAMTQQDRAAVLSSRRPGAMEAGSIQLPDSYVGERLKVSMALARASAASRDEAPSPVFMRELKCRMVAVAMDRRAGAYVVGGERSAQEARAAMPAEVLRSCRIVSQDAQRRADRAGPETSYADAPRADRPVTRLAAAARAAQSGRGF